jgi:RNA polymerase sigma-70 factor, ECF subfamily
LKEYRPLIYKVCHLYAPSREDKEDLFQEVVYQLWKSKGSFRGEAKISTWIYRIALNTAITHIRGRKPIRYVPLADEVAMESDELDWRERKEQEDRLSKAASRLTEVERALLMLYLERKSYEEMEEILGMNQNNLRVKMNRIKEKLKKWM